MITTTQYNVVSDGTKNVTEELQKLINLAAEQNEKLGISKGTYLTGSLFLKSNMEFHLEKDAVLLGSQNDEDYPIMMTRAAGIEMEWMPALLNAIDCVNITISGTGLIDGNGEKWWYKFWGPDKQGGMMKEYEEKGVRWAADYDCLRPRLVQIRNCDHVVCKEFHLTRSGFWNLHICYCKDVNVDGVIIDKEDGPSTDGIDIDSCENVIVQNCDISCNDDNIVMKAGMNADGIRQNRVCKNVVVRDCVLREGMGMAFGSDMAGGIENIQVSGLRFIGTDNGFYIKSAKIRGGYVKNVVFEDSEMVNVGYAININTNWFPAFSYPEVPLNYQGERPERWKLLTEHVPEGAGKPVIDGLLIRGLKSDYVEGFQGKSQAFYINAYDDNPIYRLTIKDSELIAKEFGTVNQVNEFLLDNVKITTVK